MAKGVGSGAEGRSKPASPAKPMVPAGRLAGRDRHMLPGWYEWVLREFARYFYALLILSLIALVPLQMSDSWLPADGPPVMSSQAVATIAVVFVLGLLVLAALGYRFLWGEEGIVDRLVERHFDLLHDRAQTDKE